MKNYRIIGIDLGVEGGDKTGKTTPNDLAHRNVPLIKDMPPIPENHKSSEKEVPEELRRIVTVALAYITKLIKKEQFFSFDNEAYTKQSLLNDADALMKKIK